MVIQVSIQMHSRFISDINAYLGCLCGYMYVCQRACIYDTRCVGGVGMPQKIHL